MDELTPLPPVISPGESSGRSLLGLLSFAAALASVLALCAALGLTYLAGTQNSGMDRLWLLELVSGAMVLLSLAGMGLGIASLVRQDSNRMLSVFALLFNGWSLTGCCVVLIIAIMLVAGNL